MITPIVWHASRREIAILASTTSTGDGFDVFVGDGDGVVRLGAKTPGQLWERLGEAALAGPPAPPRRRVFLGGGVDGSQHDRDSAGFCNSCGAPRGKRHFPVLPKADQ